MCERVANVCPRRRWSVVVGAAQVVAALGADEFAVVSGELVAAVGADLAMMLDGAKGVLRDLGRLTV